MRNTTTATDPAGGETLGRTPTPDPAPPQEPGVVDSIRHLAEAGKALAAAEADRAKTKARYVLAAGQRIAILGVIVFVMAIALVVTLLVGLMLCLEPLIGIGLALLVTVIVALVVLGLLAMGIMSQVKRIQAMP